MNKKLFNCLAALAVFGVCISAEAGLQTTTSAPGVAAGKIGVLDMRQVMKSSTQIVQIREKLQKEFKPKQEKLMAAQNTLKSDAERLRRDNAIMNNNDRKQLEQKIIAEQQDLQKMQAGFQQEVMVAENTALKGFLEEVEGIVKGIAIKKQISLVITKDPVAYVQPDLDITNEVIQKLPHK